MPGNDPNYLTRRQVQAIRRLLWRAVQRATPVPEARDADD